MSTVNWHTLSAKDVLERLETNYNGLSESKAATRLEIFGPNEIAEFRRRTKLEILISQFKSILIYLLLFAILISFLIGEMLDAFVILAIVILNGLLGFYQEYKSESALEALKRMAAPKAKVVRDGVVKSIYARELVPGDIVIVETGDRVPADGRVIEAINLRVDESILTGESHPVDKFSDPLPENTPLADRRNMLYSSTHVVYGRGRMVVTSIGMNTEFGRIAEQIQSAMEEETPLQKRLEDLGKTLGGIVILLTGLGFLLGYLRGIPLLEMLMTSISLAVSAVPEGLPAVVTIALSIGVQKMAKRNAIVKRLSSVETLGSVTVICTDKTGTLTRNEMTVREIRTLKRVYNVTGSGYRPEGGFYSDGKEIKNDKDLELLLTAGVLCNTSELIKEGDEWRIFGDPTEGALLVAGAKYGLWRNLLKEKFEYISEIPFDSARKRMSSIYRTGNRIIAFIKGAPETLLPLSKFALIDGEVKKLSSSEKEELFNAASEMANQALRVLAIAYRELPKNYDNEDVERDIIFVGLVGMIDPPREGVKEAISVCKKAGIKPVMVTGDHKLTAVAIARMIGLIEEGDLVVSGPELDKRSDKQLLEEIERISVFARVSPGHKLRIIRAYKAKGHIIAMTGDGVNDAPAVKSADVGIAMGQRGSDVTREAADIVLSDDNFVTIVNAVEEGRGIYCNIRKFVRFLLSCNFDEIAIIASSILLGLPVPLTPIQILWINIVTDGAPALALGVDPPDPDLMERPPRDPKEGILNGMWRFFVAAFILQTLGTISIFYYALQEYSLAEARTMAFTTAVFFELAAVFNCRSERYNPFKIGFSTNRKLLFSVFLSVFFQIMVIYLPFLQILFDTAPLSLEEFIMCILVGFLPGLMLIPEIFIAGEKRK